MGISFFSLLLVSFTAVTTANLIEDVANGLKNAVDCDSCHLLLIPLQGLAHLGDQIFVDSVDTVCKTFKLEDPDVCEGAIKEQGPIIAHDLRSISPYGQTATKLCDGLLGLCQPPAVNKYTVPFPKATPTLTDTKVMQSTGRTPFQVVHFSDVHIDRQYVTGSEANCRKPICCRDYADELGPPTSPAGPFGNHNCDTPATLADSMIRALASHHTWSIFTGDVVEAAVWLVNKTEVTGDLEGFNRELSSMLGAPVFPAIGNHDIAPVNGFPRNGTETLNPQWVFDIESKGWEDWIHSAASNQVAHDSGSYSVMAPETNLRIISLNTVYWYKENFWLYDSDELEPDPRGILAFAVQELQAAEDSGQRVWIIGHMPPGSTDTLRDQSNYYDQVVQRYHATIAGQFFGHTHYDQFEIAYSDYDNRNPDTAISFAWIAPALTPRSGNPAYKVYDVDPDTYEIMDSRVYITDMADPEYQNNPSWKLYYSARDTFGPLVNLPVGEPLSPAFWHRVTDVFAANDTAFQLYNQFMTRGANVKPCDGSCKALAICEMRASRAEYNCDVEKFGLTFGDNEGGEQKPLAMSSPPVSPAPQSRQCEGEGIGHILSKLSRKIHTDPLFESKLDVLKIRLQEIIPKP